MKGLEVTRHATSGPYAVIFNIFGLRWEGSRYLDEDETKAKTSSLHIWIETKAKGSSLHIWIEIKTKVVLAYLDRDQGKGRPCTFG
jgi:hypothetical protein